MAYTGTQTHTQSFDSYLVHKAWGRPEKPLTLPLRLCTRKAMLGDISSRSDSCSESFFFNLSMTLLPLLALWRVGKRGRQKTQMSFSCTCPHLHQHIFSDPWSLPSESSKKAPGRRNAVNRIHRAPAAQEGVISAISLQPDFVPSSRCPRWRCRGTYPLPQLHPVFSVLEAAGSIPSLGSHSTARSSTSILSQAEWRQLL